MTPVKDADNQHYNDWLETNDYFHDLAVFSIGTLHPGGLEASKSILDAFDWNGKTVLDIGIGNGFTIKYLSQLGATCHGVEKSEYMIRSATVNGVEEKNIYHTDVELFEFDTKYDFIIIEGVLGFIHKPILILKKCLKNLNVDGVLIINDWIPFIKSSYKLLPNYFNVYGKTNPYNIARALELLESEFSITLNETYAKSPNLLLDTAIERVENFFSVKVTQIDRKRIQNKITKMNNVLGEDTQAEYFIMKIKVANKELC